MRRIVWAVVGCWLLCACTREELHEAAPLPQLVTRSIRVEASVPASRTQLADDGYNVLWSPGDTIGVYVASGSGITTVNAPLVFEGSEPAAGGVFTGDITLAADSATYTLYAYYPYSAQSSTDATGVACTLPSRQTQSATGDSTHLGDGDFLVAGSVTSTTGDFGALTFQHAFAVVEVDLTGSGTMAGKSVASVMLFSTDAATVQSDGSLVGTANMAGNFTFDLTAATANNTATYASGPAQINYCGVDFTAPPVLGADALTAYLVVNPADYSQGDGEVYVVVSTTDGYTSTTTLPGIVISAGQMKVIRLDVSTGTAQQPQVDLSITGETANCYVVNVPSQSYSFDASTAGNGVIPEGLQQAVQQYEGRTLSAALPTTGVARLIWQSAPYLIEPGSVSYADSRITFALTERPTSLGGNAVIGLYPDETSTEALWSWHIWVSDQDAAGLEALAETYVMYSAYEEVYGAGSAVMMDRNLGAISKEDSPYARSFRASLFQWGRKDPFPWGTVYFDEHSVPHTYLSTSTVVQTTGSPGQYVGYTGNTYYATAHPEVFIATTSGSSYDWYWGGGRGNGPTYRNNELWGNPTGYTVGQTTTKTLFDPCPPGWKVPHPYVFSAFTTTGGTVDISSGEANVTGSFLQGWNFLYDGTNSTFYPGVGYRYDEYGSFSFSTTGYYWTSSPSTADLAGGYCFGLSSVRINENMTDPRGFGLPVRCMRDE